MLKVIFKYFISFLLFSILAIITIDSLLLPFLTKKNLQSFFLLDAHLLTNLKILKTEVKALEN